MKLLIIGLLFIVGKSGGPSPTNQAESILGIWQAPDLENSSIQVYGDQDGLIYGKIIASDEADWIGKVILKKVKYDASSQSWKGEVYSLRMFFTVDVELSLASKEKLKIVGKRFLMSRTFYWTREKG